MPYSVSEFGGIAAAFHEADTKQVERALKQLDPGLFLDPEIEPGKYMYWTVKHYVGSAIPPVPILEWRTPDGPKPMSMAIVEQVKRREGKGETALREAIEANQRRREASLEATGDASFDIALEGGKSAQGKKSVNLPRSQSLRMSRDRQRAKGRKV